MRRAGWSEQKNKALQRMIKEAKTMVFASFLFLQNVFSDLFFQAGVQ
jgi:hypothetical protein